MRLNKNILSIVSIALVTTWCQFTSCSEKREIVPNNLIDYWELQNDVQFNSLTFKHLDFYQNDYDGAEWIECLVDAVTSDTIYHYKRVTIKGDSLILMDDIGKQLVLTIKELHDSILVIENFPGTDKDLEFKGSLTISKESEVMGVFGKEYKTSDFPKESLDINDKYYDTRELRDLGEPYALDHKQFDKARNILGTYVRNKEYLKDQYSNNDNVLPYDNYFRQYIGYKKDGDIIVWVSMFTSFINMKADTRYFDYLKLYRCILMADGGGNEFATAHINLTQGKVIDFFPNNDMP